jgi:hypothetical protein
MLPKISFERERIKEIKARKIATQRRNIAAR